MVAIAGALELHVPPIAASLNVVVPPAITLAIPVTVPAKGSGLTVTTFVATTVPQPFVTAYDIITVPAAIPVTTPLVSIVAMPDAPVLHEPPLTELLNVVVLP